MFDLKKLLGTPFNGEIARGSGPLPELDIQEAKWVAVKGMYHDWAIYYGSPSQSWEEIRDYGTKLQREKAIKRLVPCTNGMYRRYRW